MMQRTIGLASLLLIVWLSPVALAQEVDFPVLTGRIVDDAQLLTSVQEKMLTDWLVRHEDETTNQVVIVTVPTLQGLEIEGYGYQLGRHWGIGQADHDNGVLLIVAPEERKVRIEVGYGLEGALTDAESRIIIDRYLLPAFRTGDYGKGIEDAVPAILLQISGEDFAKEPSDQSGFTTLEWLVIIAMVMLLLVPVFVFIKEVLSSGELIVSTDGNSKRGTRRRGLGGGRRRSGRGGGFRGGGGSFGGGGASGSW
jgi:uncharacterized protein